MIYRAIGIMSGSSLDGLDIAFVQFQEQAGRWDIEILQSLCTPYKPDWVKHLSEATGLRAHEYQLLHTKFGRFIGEQVNEFIDKNHLQYQVSLIASHGHTVFHDPQNRMTAQLGDGAAIAAVTGLPVVTDLRSLDIALGGEGAPIVPIGEKYLFPGYDLFLNLGGIANISLNTDPYIAFDICPANRVLNLLAQDTGREYDDEGMMAAKGRVSPVLLQALNNLSYYGEAYPKSLANEFGTKTIYPMIRESDLAIPDSLCTYCEHIAEQTGLAIKSIKDKMSATGPHKIMVTGGGAFNIYLMQRLQSQFRELEIELVIPEASLVQYKEAAIMAFIGVLRWRQEQNVLASVTGAMRNSIGGALWLG
jgi:anhydro-N-acetylmuramic acid kinase